MDKRCKLQLNPISSEIRQKGESQNGCHKKTKHPNSPKNKHFLPHETRKCVRNIRFSENLDVLFSWNARLEIPPFALLPTIWHGKIGDSADDDDDDDDDELLLWNGWPLKGV